MDYYEKISLSEMEILYKKELNARVKTRLLMIINKKKGKSYHKIAEIFNSSSSTPLFWVRRFRKFGYNGLLTKKGQGTKGRLSVAAKKKIKEFSKGKTSKEVMKHINDKFGFEYHPNSVPRLLKGLGLSRITPRKRHYKADQEKQDKFKKILKKTFGYEKERIKNPFS
jgi:transposase